MKEVKMRDAFLFSGTNGSPSSQRGRIVERRPEDGLGMETQRTFRNEPEQLRLATPYRRPPHSHGPRFRRLRPRPKLRLRRN